jgi:hypothetical protein
MSTAEIRSRLDELEAERAVAVEAGVAGIPAYLDDLEREIGHLRSAFVGAAVTEIATLRGQLSGPQRG